MTSTPHYFEKLIRDIKLFGRDNDLKTISAFLANEDIGAITIRGGPGTGKTAFANHAAHANKINFSNGAVLIELAPVREEGMIIQKILEAVHRPRQLRTPDQEMQNHNRTHRKAGSLQSLTLI